MGITGSFRVGIPKHTLRNMKSDTAGYIFCDEFILSRDMLCIPLDTEVFYRIEDMQNTERAFHYPFVAIYKVNEGLSSKAFDIDLEEDPGFPEMDFELSTVALTKSLADTHDWIGFQKPKIFYDEVSAVDNFDQHIHQIESSDDTAEVLHKPLVISNLRLTELKTELDAAIEIEDYDLAAKIRDEIKKRKKDTTE